MLSCEFDSVDESGNYLLEHAIDGMNLCLCILVSVFQLAISDCGLRKTDNRRHTNLPKCHGCHLDFEIGSACVIEALGYSWHDDCFRWRYSILFHVCHLRFLQVLRVSLSADAMVQREERHGSLPIRLQEEIPRRGLQSVQ